MQAVSQGQDREDSGLLPSAAESLALVISAPPTKRSRRTKSRTKTDMAQNQGVAAAGRTKQAVLVEVSWHASAGRKPWLHCVAGRQR